MFSLLKWILIIVTFPIWLPVVIIGGIFVVSISAALIISGALFSIVVFAELINFIAGKL